MTRFAIVAILCLGFISFGAADLYQQCSNTKAAPTDLAKAIMISTCRKTYCRLRRGTKIDVTMKFTPANDVKSLQNSVRAEIAGIPFPFIGVDGTSACNNLFTADGATKVACPLKGGSEYMYKTQIDVLPIYPTLKLVVNWALIDPSFGDVSCFKVPAKITN